MWSQALPPQLTPRLLLAAELPSRVALERESFWLHTLLHRRPAASLSAPGTSSVWEVAGSPFPWMECRFCALFSNFTD